MFAAPGLCFLNAVDIAIVLDLSSSMDMSELLNIDQQSDIIFASERPRISYSDDVIFIKS